MSSKRTIFIVGSVFLALIAILLMFLVVVSPTAAQDIIVTNTPFAQIAATPAQADIVATIQPAEPYAGDVQPVIVLTPVYSNPNQFVIDETSPGTPIIIRVQNDPIPNVDDGKFTALIIGSTMIILGLIGAYAYTQGKSVAALYQSLPMSALTLFRGGLEVLSNKAAITPTPLDDAALSQLTNALGYDSTQTEDGRIILTLRPLTPVPF